MNFVDKGDEHNISALDPLTDTSTKYIAIPNDFLTVPSTYKTLESNAVSFQDSLQKYWPNTFAKIASILTAVLQCQQEAAGLNQEINCRIGNFETQFDTRGFVHKVLMSLTWSHSNDPDTNIKELSGKYDLDIFTRATDVVLKNLTLTIVTHEALKLALSIYVK